MGCSPHAKMLVATPHRKLRGDYKRIWRVPQRCFKDAAIAMLPLKIEVPATRALRLRPPPAERFPHQFLRPLPNRTPGLSARSFPEHAGFWQELRRGNAG